MDRIIESTKPGIELASADLERADIGVAALGRMIMQNIAPHGDGSPEAAVLAMLAAILKNQAVARCRYNVYPYKLQNTTTTGSKQQFLPENPNRKFFALQVIGRGIAGPISILFESGPQQQQTLSMDDVETEIERGLMVDVEGGNGAELYVAPVAPTNPITLVVQTNSVGNGEQFGIIIEGV